jgi:hypothetical protein
VIAGVAIGFGLDRVLDRGPGDAAPLACVSAPRPSLVQGRLSMPVKECIGFSDSPDQLFGEDGGTRLEERLLLAQNTANGHLYRPDSDLTLILLGGFTCLPAADGGCGSDDLSTPREELQALRAYAAYANTHADVPDVHVVVANAGRNVTYADQVAEMIATARARFGTRLAVVGGTDSTEQTRRAVETLLAAGIPVVTPTLTANSPTVPGVAFVDRPGFLQLPTANDGFAEDAIRWILDLTRGALTQGSPVVVYRESSPGDDYTSTLARELSAAAQRHGLAPVPVSTLAGLDTSICRNAPQPRPVVFADRQNRFAAPADPVIDFVRAVTLRCADLGGPYLVVGDDATNRAMKNDDLRGNPLYSAATWGLAWYLSGWQCSDLLRQYATDNAAGTPSQAGRLIDVARTELGITCSRTGSGQIGSNIAPMWDAAVVADAMLRGVDQPLHAADLGSLPDRAVALAEGSVLVKAGRVTQPLPVVRTCTMAFSGRPTGDVTVPPDFSRSPNFCADLVRH